MQTKDLAGQESMFDPGTACGKMCQGVLQVRQTESPARTSGRSSRRSSGLKNRTLMLLDLRPGAGNMLGSYWEYDPAWLGRSGGLNTSACPKGATESSLSQILHASVPSKYYLSRTACRGILRRSEERGKPLPPQLELALKLQAGIIRSPPGIPVSELLRTAMDEQGATVLLIAFAANQYNGVPVRAQRSGSHGERSRSVMSELPPQGGSEGYGACGDAVRDLHNLSAALSAQPGMKQQTFIVSCLNPWDTQQSRVFTPEGTAPTLASADGGGGRNPGGLVYAAGFSANAGSKAGSTGYQEELAPTLKGSQSGGMMPSVLCLNDQGGQRMDVTVDQTSTLRSQAGGHPPLICLNDQGGSIMSCSENVAGTLRAQEHGHQPLIFENHGIDGRYTGPHDIAPTLSARAGTGGNNLPIALQGGDWCETAFARQRADSFRESNVASTESARQHKDATDLVLQPDDDGPAILLIRRLTPRECELLQGFPPDWTDLPGASDSARYKSLGNSVPVPCVEYLMQGIALALRAGL